MVVSGLLRHCAVPYPTRQVQYGTALAIRKLQPSANGIRRRGGWHNLKIWGIGEKRKCKIPSK